MLKILDLDGCLHFVGSGQALVALPTDDGKAELCLLWGPNSDGWEFSLTLASGSLKRMSRIVKAASRAKLGALIDLRKLGAEEPPADAAEPPDSDAPEEAEATPAEASDEVV